jgi:hypothetical protein
VNTYNGMFSIKLDDKFKLIKFLRLSNLSITLILLLLKFKVYS